MGKCVQVDYWIVNIQKGKWIKTFNRFLDPNHSIIASINGLRQIKTLRKITSMTLSTLERMVAASQQTGPPYSLSEREIDH